MDVSKQLKQVQELYSSNLRTLGIGSKAVGWNTNDCQMLRLSKLATVIGEGDTPFSVNDYGCGYGSLLKFLTESLGHQVSGYNGYDISAEMLTAARRELADWRGNLQLLESSTIDTQADYSFVSGTFNVRFDAEKDAWEAFIERQLEQMNQHSTRGFAFNLLTSYVDWEEPHLYYGDPRRWFDFCKRRYSRYVSLIHDYPLWEWTIVVRK